MIKAYKAFTKKHPVLRILVLIALLIGTYFVAHEIGYILGQIIHYFGG